jgi:hypothetical protein
MSAIKGVNQYPLSDQRSLFSPGAAAANFAA